LIPQTVSPGRLQQANGLLSLTESGFAILGPVVAGVLVATVGSGWALATDAATFLISAVFLSQLQVPRLAERVPASFLSELRAGWREFTSRTWLWVDGLFSAFGNLAVLAPIWALAPSSPKNPWVERRPGRRSSQRSGSARSSRAWPRFASSPSDLCSLESAPSSCLGFPRPCSPCPAPTPLLAAGAFAAGFGLILFNTLFETTVQQHVPAAALSRVSSIDWMLSLGLYPIGLALAGWVAEVIGVGATLAVAAAWALLSTPLVLAVPSVRNLRRRDGPPEADPATIQPL